MTIDTLMVDFSCIFSALNQQYVTFFTVTGLHDIDEYIQAQLLLAVSFIVVACQWQKQISYIRSLPGTQDGRQNALSNTAGVSIMRA